MPACRASPTLGERLRAPETAAVVVSLGNLVTFPFVRSAVDADDLTLHSLWTATAEGTAEQFDPGTGGFVAV
jgi:carbonic anhydrase